MPIEPSCEFCGISDKNRCKTLDYAHGCKLFNAKEYKMKKVDQIEDFDFGFSFTDDVVEAKNQVETLQNERMTDKEIIESLDKRLKVLYNAIIPFLDNLCKNPEKSTIHWPNRVEKITSYKKKLKSIVEGD